MEQTETFQLTKTRYVEGILCRKRLWLQHHRRELATPPSVAQQRTMDEGTRVGILARERMFSHGLLVTQVGAPAVKETAIALTRNPPAIFEATFLYDGILIMADMIANNFDGTWDLIEVKASTKLKPEYLHDIAMQTYVIEQAGLWLRRQRLLHINSKEALRPDHANLFHEQDVTAEVADYLDDLPGRVADFHGLLAREEEPAVPIGHHCQKPYPCPFQTYCWQNLPEPSIFSIPRLKGKEKSRLAQQGILSLHDLPPEFPLSGNQQDAVLLMQEEREEIDIPAIRKKLKTLTYPIYFFDFETDAAAIPSHSGLRPYEQAPFQYSCHILYEDGRLAHCEYLHTDTNDTREPLLMSLMDHIGPVGSVVVYNAQFERSVLRKLAALVPAYERAIQSVIDRLWDQLDIFRQDYKSYRFRGSNSIKNVLPVIAPHLSYKGLRVSRGDEAQAVWAKMVRTTEPAAKQQMIDDLLVYCRQDTLAMVEIHKHLKELTTDER
ncbi:MAG: DUF2779 domain-containing protein [Chloroflexota bacterium]